MKMNMGNNSKKSDAKATEKQRIKRNWKITAGILALIFVAVMLANTNHAEAETLEMAVIGQSVGNFSLEDLDGNLVGLSDYKGKTVLINAWATWCPPCRAEMPDLERYYQNHAEDGFVILAINAGDSREDAQGFVTSNHLSFPVLLDQDLEVLQGLGISGFPTSILIDSNGIVQYIHIGMFRPDDLELKITPHL